MLNDRAVRHRIGEGDTEFNNVRAGFDDALDQFFTGSEVRTAALDEDDQCGPVFGFAPGEDFL
ncbi:hypothetical protein SDC9_167302 [bioreactor metagenome]|uniref:Uncharacterized protein n=1 Tax=bioreactor metagenome TaxID=1076179 RepID=A0A645FZF3_9ZZZZ